MTRKEMELYSEIERLRAKLNLASDIAKRIDGEVFDISFNHNSNDIKIILEQIKETRKELRDFSDFLKERKGAI